jgi:hypothetical protein
MYTFHRQRASVASIGLDYPGLYVISSLWINYKVALYVVDLHAHSLVIKVRMGGLRTGFLPWA